MALRDLKGDSPRVSQRTSRLSLAAASAALILLLGAGGVLAWLAGHERVPLDDAMCPTDRPPPSVQAILLDASDPLGAAQRLTVANELTRLRRSLPAMARVEIYAIEPTSGLLAPKAALCNPGDGSKMSPWYQNPELARRRWRAAFEEPLAQLVEARLAHGKAPVSPIYEAIQAIAVRTFGRPEFDAVPKRLFVVSDLIQYVPGVQSHYDGVPDFDAFSRSAYFRRVRADLRGVEVHLIYLARATSPVQGSEHILFWQRYFARQGAIVSDVLHVYGEGT